MELACQFHQPTCFWKTFKSRVAQFSAVEQSSTLSMSQTCAQIQQCPDVCPTHPESQNNWSCPPLLSNSLYILAVQMFKCSNVQMFKCIPGARLSCSDHCTTSIAIEGKYPSTEIEISTQQARTCRKNVSANLLEIQKRIYSKYKI